MSWRSELQARWQAASKREQQMLLFAAGLVALALLWWLALAPALSVLKKAEAQHQALEAQLQHMQRLQAQAKALQALPALDAQESRRALEALLKPLGATAQMTVQMDRLVVSLKGLQAQVLAQWLAGVRQNAHLLPTEAHLKPAPGGNGQWEGTLVFTLPPQ